MFHNGSGYDFNLFYSEVSKQNNDKRSVACIPNGNGRSKMFSVVSLNFNKKNSVTMSLEQMAKIYGCKTKDLFLNEYFTLENYKEVIGDLKINDLKSFLYSKIPTEREIGMFNRKTRNKTGKKLTIHYLTQFTKRFGIIRLWY